MKSTNSWWKHFTQQNPWYVLSVPILTYSVFILAAFFQKNHLLFNLEPYPDGLLYALSARNFVTRGKLELNYQDSTLKYWVPPLYSYVLVIGYLFSLQPTTFYLINCVLCIGAAVIITHIVWFTTKNIFATVTAQCIFFLHAYISFVPSVPMAENLVLLLFSLSLWALFTNQSFSIKKWFVSVASAGALLFTKSSVFPVVLVLLGIACWQLGKNKMYRKWLAAPLLACAFLGLAYAYLYPDNLSSILTLSTSVDGHYFSLAFLFPNFVSYARSLTLRGYFLWQNTPLSSIGVLVLFLCTPLWFRFMKSAKTSLSILLVLLFFAQFAVLLIFYTVDTRYALCTIPLVALQLGWLMKDVLKRKKWAGAGIIGIVTMILAYQQLPLFKLLINDNLLGRSVAWQYQSITHFNRYFLDKPQALVVTALPPFLVDAYQTSNYRALPLSQNQEFIQKQEYVWGSDINYQALIDEYKNDLEKGTPLYISNAYITQHSSVIADYENYKKEFKLELVSEGCLSACNIYKLSVLDDISNK